MSANRTMENMLHNDPRIGPAIGGCTNDRHVVAIVHTCGVTPLVTVVSHAEMNTCCMGISGHRHIRLGNVA